MCIDINDSWRSQFFNSECSWKRLLGADAEHSKFDCWCHQNKFIILYDMCIATRAPHINFIVNRQHIVVVDEPIKTSVSVALSLFFIYLFRTNIRISICRQINFRRLRTWWFRICKESSFFSAIFFRFEKKLSTLLLGSITNGYLIDRLATSRLILVLCQLTELMLGRKDETNVHCAEYAHVGIHLQSKGDACFCIFLYSLRTKLHQHQILTHEKFNKICSLPSERHNAKDISKYVFSSTILKWKRRLHVNKFWKSTTDEAFNSNQLRHV